MFDNQTPEEMFLESVKGWAEDELLCGEDMFVHLERVGRVKGKDAVRQRLQSLIYRYMTEVLGYTIEKS